MSRRSKRLHRHRADHPAGEPGRVPNRFSRLHLVHLADLRNRGQTWDETAEAAAEPYEPTPGEKLRARLAADPQWRKVLRDSRKELFADALAESVHILRIHVRDKSPALAARVANHLARIGETFIRHRKKLRPDDPVGEEDLLEGQTEEAIASFARTVLDEYEGKMRMKASGNPDGGDPPDGDPPPDGSGNVPRPPHGPPPGPSTNGADVPDCDDKVVVRSPDRATGADYVVARSPDRATGADYVVARSPDRATGGDRRSPGFEEETCGRAGWSGPETRPQQQKTRPQQGDSVVARSPDHATGCDRRSPGFEEETCGRAGWSGPETRPQQQKTRPQQGDSVVARSPDRATGGDRRSPGFEEETCGRAGWSGPETRPQQEETRPHHHG